MNRRARTGVLAALAVLAFPFGGQAQSLIEGGAEGACQSRARELFPEFASWFGANRGLMPRAAVDTLPTPDNDASAPTIGIPMELRILDRAKFVMRLPARLKKAGRIDLVCRGDLAERRISSIRFNGMTKRPAEGEAWSY